MALRGERGGATVAPPKRGERGPIQARVEDRRMPLKRTQQFVVFTFLQSELKTGEGCGGGEEDTGGERK